MISIPAVPNLPSQIMISYSSFVVLATELVKRSYETSASTESPVTLQSQLDFSEVICESFFEVVGRRVSGCLRHLQGLYRRVTYHRREVEYSIRVRLDVVWVVGPRPGGAPCERAAGHAVHGVALTAGAVGLAPEIVGDLISVSTLLPVNMARSQYYSPHRDWLSLTHIVRSCLRWLSY